MMNAFMLIIWLLVIVLSNILCRKVLASGNLLDDE
jgi:hypothetical protein